MIFERPIFGFGAGTFLVNFYIIRSGYRAIHHTHNMPMEIAYNYGIPASLLLTTFVSFLWLKGREKIYNPENGNSTILNKSILGSVMVIIIFHLSDITYYEGRISLLTWILLAALKCIIVH